MLIPDQSRQYSFFLPLSPNTVNEPENTASCIYKVQGTRIAIVIKRCLYDPVRRGSGVTIISTEALLTSCTKVSSKAEPLQSQGLTLQASRIVV